MSPGEDATFTDPELAGRRLGSLLDSGPRRLLVLDDVWTPEQLAPFSEGGKQCNRLVTTRVPELLVGRAVAVRVDQMSPQQARDLLTSGLPELDPAVADGLLAVTGRWPLLLRLVNKILADYARMATDVSDKGAVLLARLRAGGPAVVDDLLGTTGRTLDVGRPQERARAIRATIGASTGMLDGNDAERFAELGMFAEDEVIPFALLARLWRTTASLDDLQAAQVCRRLAQLALVAQVSNPVHSVIMHDVIREFLRAELGEHRLSGLNGLLLDSLAADFGAEDPLGRNGLGPVRAAWWNIKDDDPYLWGHLIEHLRDATRLDEADAVAGDLRWVAARLERFGPAAPAADLSAVGTPRANRLWAVLARVAHLLAPAEPTGAVVDVLHSRVARDPDWGPQVNALRNSCRRPRLVNRWPPPDLPSPALRRVLVGHTGEVMALAVAPDGSWLASGSWDKTVRIWDPVTGRERAVLTGHMDRVTALAVAPDGSWLASGSWDKTVRIWDPATGRERAVLTGHSGEVIAVVAAPDGRWLASGGRDDAVRIWDPANGRVRATQAMEVTALTVAPGDSWLVAGNLAGVGIWDPVAGPEQVTIIDSAQWVRALAMAPDGRWLAIAYGQFSSWGIQICTFASSSRLTLADPSYRTAALAVAPDGSWLASGNWEGRVRVWNPATGRERFTLVGHRGEVAALAVAPDGSWLASGGRDFRVRIWDPFTDQERAIPVDNMGHITAVAVAPNWSWLAASDREGRVCIWDAASRRERTTMAVHSEWVTALVVAPDGSWLASGGADYRVRVWDPATGQERMVLTGHVGQVTAVAVAPDGSWLASGSRDKTVRIWDPATGQERMVLTGHVGQVTAVAVAPDGSWLASGSQDKTVRIWDPVTGHGQAVLAGHRGQVTTVAVAPNGKWLASGGWDNTVRIWGQITWQTRALMRIDDNVSTSAWLGAEALVVGGPAGMYAFDLLTGASQTAADW